MVLGHPRKCASTASYPRLPIRPVPNDIREHLGHLHHAIEHRSLPRRVAITVGALLSLPLFGTTVRTTGRTLQSGELVLPPLVVAHVPAVVVLIGVWSIGCELCRGGDSA